VILGITTTTFGSKPSEIQMEKSKVLKIKDKLKREQNQEKTKINQVKNIKSCRFIIRQLCYFFVEISRRTSLKIFLQIL